MWAQFLVWLKDNQIGDLTGLLGLCVSFVGFAVTTYRVRQTEKAVHRATAEIMRYEAVTDITSAIAVLEEVKRIQRNRDWTLLPDRYALIRKILVTLRGSGINLNGEHHLAIQAALATLNSLEAEVEKGIEKPEKLNHVRFNRLISGHIDSLASMLADLKIIRGEK